LIFLILEIDGGRINIKGLLPKRKKPRGSRLRFRFKKRSKVEKPRIDYTIQFVASKVHVPKTLTKTQKQKQKNCLKYFKKPKPNAKRLDNYRPLKKISLTDMMYQKPVKFLYME
jgi:hypothetical protein